MLRWSTRSWICDHKSKIYFYDLTKIFMVILFLEGTHGFSSSQLNNTGAGRKLFGGYRITPKNCRATRTLFPPDARIDGPTICMFNHECAQRNGAVVGACMDGFLFGACCQIPHNYNIESTLINNAQDAYYQQYYQQHQKLKQPTTTPNKAQSPTNLQNATSEDAHKLTVDQSLLLDEELQSVLDPVNTNQVQTLESGDQSNLQHETAANSSYFLEASPSASNVQTNDQKQSQNKQDLRKHEQTKKQEELGNQEDLNKPQDVEKQDGFKIKQDLKKHQNQYQHNSHKPNVSKVPANGTESFGDLDYESQTINYTSSFSTIANPHPSQLHSGSSLPTPIRQADRVTYTTDLPSKIPLVSQSGSSDSNESNLLEEFHSDQMAEAQQVAEVVQTLSPYKASTHQYDHLMLDLGEFTHSDITHPAADTEILEDDLQFSTGYGPQPVFVKLPSSEQHVEEQNLIKPPSPDDKYVLVQTITNEEQNKKPAATVNSAPASSSTTLSADSIESIILQLNNKSQGGYDWIYNQQTPTYSPINAINFPSANTQSAPRPLSSTIHSLADTSTDPPGVSFYDAAATTQTGNPNLLDKNQHQKYPTKPTQVVHLVTHHKNISKDVPTAPPISNVSTPKQPTTKPTSPTIHHQTSNFIDDSEVIEEHTLPETNYNDVSGANHHTSEFNKMPAVGIAYPVDMSYFGSAEGNIAPDSLEHQLAYTQKPVSISQKLDKLSTVTQIAYTKVPTISEKMPEGYPALITTQSYNRRPQLPQEVSVTSHTTHVHSGEHIHALPPTNEKPAPFKLLEGIIIHETSSNQPSYTLLGTSPHAIAPTTHRPHLITAKPRPKPERKPTQPRPETNNGFDDSKEAVVAITKGSSARPTQGHLGPQTLQPVTTIHTPVQLINKNKEPQTPLENDNMEPIFTRMPISETTPGKNTMSTGPPLQALNSYGLEELGSSTGEKQNTTNIIIRSDIPNAPDKENTQQPLVPGSTSSSYTVKPTTIKTTNAQDQHISTSYITGPTSPRPISLLNPGNQQLPKFPNDKLDSFAHSTAPALEENNPSFHTTHSSQVVLSSAAPINIQHPPTHLNYPKPGFVKVRPTVNLPEPTVYISPKPTAINVISSSTWVHRPSFDDDSMHTTVTPSLGSTSYISGPLVTHRPDSTSNIPEYLTIRPVSSNDFEDPPYGYYGIQNTNNKVTTESVFPLPSDDRPAFPGYYGPTPTYPVFQVPNEKLDPPVEFETYTSPNDFVNFPPVRNPNLNMSATSSAVTNDIEISTPAFVEDVILKDKMNTLVHKIVESLQGNFEALSELIDDPNEAADISVHQAIDVASKPTVTQKPSRKPSGSTAKPKLTTKKPATRISTKATTRKPTIGPTRKPVTRRTTTKRPITRKPTRKATTTTLAPVNDDFVDEEDEEDASPSENEVEEENSAGGVGGRKFQCGLRPHMKSARIVGGKGSTFGAFPWQVLVRESTWLGLFTKNKCGGVLITNRYIITAAHCQPGFLASLVAVMGEYDISGDVESKRSVTKNVKRVIVHRQYDAATFENDLALLELDSPVQFDTHIIPICMPADTADFTGRMATVTGWGRLKYAGGVPSVLQEVQVPIIENSVCQEMFYTAGHNKKILNSFLCAGYANGQKDSCEGDSGGPLVLQRPDGRYELAGTVSHGIKCAAPYLPGVYMRTTYYKPWLRSITGVK